LLTEIQLNFAVLNIDIKSPKSVSLSTDHCFFIS